MCHAFLTMPGFIAPCSSSIRRSPPMFRRAVVGTAVAGCMSPAIRVSRAGSFGLDASYQYRLSFCCASDGCRRRTTPPSVRFLGRKVYLGVIVVLVTAPGAWPDTRSAEQLIEQLDLWPQTIARWQRWWREQVPATRVGGRCSDASCHRSRPRLTRCLAGSIGRAMIWSYVCADCLALLAPLTTTSWASSLRVVIDPQKM